LGVAADTDRIILGLEPMPNHCDECGGWTDRPGLFGCDRPPHPAPDLAQRIARAIERDLTDRRGFGWDDVAEETQYAIRERWVEIIRRELDAGRGSREAAP
jgi:hypothetical protein